MARLEGDFLDVVRQWGESIESKDVHTQGHCERVADLAGALAAKAGLRRDSLFWFRIGALLHDVGKLIVPAEVLNKPGQLTDEEWALDPPASRRRRARCSPTCEFPWDVAPMVRSHHERWDGQGYPDGLAGEAIPLAGAHPLHRRRLRRADDGAQLQARVLAPRGDGDHAPRVGHASSIRSCSRSSRSWCGAARINAAAHDGAARPGAAHRARSDDGHGVARRTISRARSCGARS